MEECLESCVIPPILVSIAVMVSGVCQVIRVVTLGLPKRGDIWGSARRACGIGGEDWDHKRLNIPERLGYTQQPIRFADVDDLAVCFGIIGSPT